MKSSKKFFFTILTKQGEKFVLTHIMNFIEPHRHERNHPLVNGYCLDGKRKEARKMKNSPPASDGTCSKSF